MATQRCGCPVPALDGVYGLVDPGVEVLLELDERGVVTAAYPHDSPILRTAPCAARPLAELVSAAIAARLRREVEHARSEGQPITQRLWSASLQTRVVPRERGAIVILRDTHEDAFSRLFETAPLPLGLLSNKSTIGDGSTRFNRRFTELFGYSAEDVPTAAHWWPLAYPDPAYRESVRTEWYRRVQKAIEDGTPVQPLEVKVHCKDGSIREIEFFATDMGDSRLVVFVDLTERNRIARELDDAHENVRTLSELLPICAWCKRLRDDRGYWQQVEQFINERTGVRVTHGICPDCRAEHFEQNGSGSPG